MVVIGEFSEVLVDEVGGAVQLLPGEQAQDLGLLALASGVDAGWCVVVGPTGLPSAEASRSPRRPNGNWPRTELPRVLPRT